MFLNPKMNLFRFEFTRNTFPQEIIDKYSTYLNSVVGSPIKSVPDYVNYTIQGINLPGLSQDTVEQNGVYGWNRKYRSSTHEQMLYTKDFTITLRMTDGFLNYWICYDLLKYYYDYYGEHEKEFIYMPDQRLEILDGDGHVVTNILLKRVLMASISDLSLNFSSQTPDFQTFDISCQINELEIKQMFDI